MFPPGGNVAGCNLIAIASNDMAKRILNASEMSKKRWRKPGERERFGKLMSEKMKQRWKRLRELERLQAAS